jgi:uncharacterized protein (TIGR02246 family)
MEEGDVPRLLSLLTHDAILKMPSSPALVGKEAVEHALRAFHAECSEAVEHHVDEVEVSGDMAFVRVTEKVIIRSKSGDGELRTEGMHLAILRRQPSGVWLVARDISSLDH